MELRNRIPGPVRSLADLRGLRSRLGAPPVPDALPRPDVGIPRLRSAATALSLAGLALAVVGVLGRLLIDRREAAEAGGDSKSGAAVQAPPQAPDRSPGGDEGTDTSIAIPDREDVSPGDDDGPKPASERVESLDEPPEDSPIARIGGATGDRTDDNEGANRIDPDTGAPRIAPLVGIAALVVIRLVEERLGGDDA